MSTNTGAQGQRGEEASALGEATLCAAFQRTAAMRPDSPALRTEGDQVAITWAGYAERVRAIAGGLHALGLRRGDTLALMLTNRPEFNLVDAAALHLGAIPFSVYTTCSPEQVAFQLRDAGARIAVTERALRERLEQADAPEHVVVVDEPGALEQLERHGATGFDFEPSWRAVTPDDTATLIYTSGTTGPPKGVELTHRNVLAGWRGVLSAWADARPSDGGRVISYLPHAHIADRFATHYASMLFGHTVTCCPDPRQIGRLLYEVRPTQFMSVPRIWQKLQAAAESALTERPEQADEAARAAVRARLGLDLCEVAVCASAPMPREVLEFFRAVGIPISEVYGLSETCAVATANPPGRVKIGTVGPAVPGVEVRLAADGEVLLRGEVVMRGYRNRPDRTVEAIDAEGWLHTGDVGVLDDDGYLRIVDRKKELIISAGGKNMSPANIEATLRGASPLIGQACVIGDGRSFNVALLTLEPDASAAFAARHGEDAVAREIAAAVERANSRLSHPEQVKRYRLLEHDWQPGGIELTPTMKLRRRAIAERYAAIIESLYAETQSVQKEVV